MTATMTAERYVMLVLVNAGGNNNKFYELTLQGDAVTARYGRVGATGQTKVYGGGAAKFEAQMRAKMAKGYQQVDVADAPAGAGGGAGVARSTLTAIARKRLMQDAGDAALARLIDGWAAANRHNIEATSGGKITVSASGAVTTPVGMVSASAIAEARDVLDRIATTPTIRDVERYLTLVPQDVGRTRGWEDAWLAGRTVARQKDFLDELDGAVALAATTADDGKDAPDAHFAHSLVRVEKGSDKWNDVERRFSSTKLNNHTSSSLRMTGLYAVRVSADANAAWEDLAAQKGNVRRLWHGTGDYNLLSIFHRGFVVPPSHNRGTFQVTGRMFGDGVYMSDQSTKSLNYSQGYWSGRRQNHCFMLMVDAIMGKTYEAVRYGDAASTARRGGYDSIFAKGGTAGVRNNEMIVWNVPQLRISYLAEFA